MDRDYKIIYALFGTSVLLELVAIVFYIIALCACETKTKTKLYLHIDPSSGMSTVTPIPVNPGHVTFPL